MPELLLETRARGHWCFSLNPRDAWISSDKEHYYYYYDWRTAWHCRAGREFCIVGCVLLGLQMNYDTQMMSICSDHNFPVGRREVRVKYWGRGCSAHAIPVHVGSRTSVALLVVVLLGFGKGVGQGAVSAFQTADGHCCETVKSVLKLVVARSCRTKRKRTTRAVCTYYYAFNLLPSVRWRGNGHQELSVHTTLDYIHIQLVAKRLVKWKIGNESWVYILLCVQLVAKCSVKRNLTTRAECTDYCTLNHLGGWCPNYGERQQELAWPCTFRAAAKGGNVLVTLLQTFVVHLWCWRARDVTLEGCNVPVTLLQEVMRSN